MNFTYKLLILFCLNLIIFSLDLFSQESNNVSMPNENKVRYLKINHQFDNTTDTHQYLFFIHDLFPELKNYEYELNENTIKLNKNGKYISFIQTYKNIQLGNYYIKLIIDKNGKLLSVIDGLYKDKFICNEIYPDSLNYIINESKSISERISKEFSGKIFSSYPVWFQKDNIFKLFIKTNLYFDKAFGVSQFLVDFNNQKEYIIEDRTINFLPTDTIGKGYVYYPNPITSANVVYDKNSMFYDNNDSTNSALNAERKLVDLKYLYYNQDSFKFELKGSFAIIKDLGPPFIKPTSSTTSNFLFNRSQSGFEDVNVYFHVNEFQNYIQSLGFDDLKIDSLSIDPHGKNEDNSEFKPAGKNSYILFGIGGVDDAEDADVIIHEYTHSISYAASPETNEGFERRGIDEGFCDYTAASYSRFKSINQWDKIFNWDGHNEFWKGRVANAPENYKEVSQGVQDIYKYGSVLCSALTELWNQIDQRDVDKIVFQTLYSLEKNLTTPIAAQLILDADTLINDGKYGKEIACTFCNKKILPDDFCDKFECTVNRADVNQTPLVAQIFPNPVTHIFQLKVENNLPQNTLNYKIFNIFGVENATGGFNGNFTHIDFSNYTSGLYFINISNNYGQSVTVKFIKY